MPNLEIKNKSFIDHFDWLKIRINFGFVGLIQNSKIIAFYKNDFEYRNALL